MPDNVFAPYRTLDEILEKYEDSIVASAQEHEGEIMEVAGK